MNLREIVGLNTKWYRYQNNYTQEKLRNWLILKWLILVLWKMAKPI